MAEEIIKLDNASIPSTTENNSSVEELDIRRTLGENIILSLMVSLIAITSIFGNLLVIVCFRWNPRLREETGNIFIVNLSIADITCASTVMVSTVVALLADEWHSSNILCDAMCAANYVLIIVSMLTLCFISIDRFIAVVYALQYYEIVTMRKTFILISYAWFQGFCFGLSPPLRNWVHYDYWEMVCAINWARDVGAIVYVIFAFVLCFLIPGIVLATAYTKIIHVARSFNSHAVGVVQHHNESILKRFRNRCCRTRRNHKNDENVKIFKRRNPSRDSQMMPIEEEIRRRSDISMHSYIVDQKNLRSSVDFDRGRMASGSIDATDSNVELQPMSIAVISVAEYSNDGEDAYHRQSKQTETMIHEEHSDSKYNLTKMQQTEQSNVETLVNEPSVKVTDNEGPSNGNYSKSHNGHSRQSELQLKERYHSPNGAGRKAIQSLMVVVIVFFVCMTPFCITKLYKVIMRNTGALPGYVNVTATIFQYCSSAVNPFIYAIFRKDFQQACKKLLSVFLAKCRSTLGKKCNCAQNDDFMS